MLKLRIVVCTIFLLVGAVIEKVSAQDSIEPPEERERTSPPGLQGPVGNPAMCPCESSENQQIITELIAEITKNRETIANLTRQASAITKLHKPTFPENVCTIPHAPKFGAVISSHKHIAYNQRIFYTCDEGFFMDGISSNILLAKCQKNGTWTVKTPACIASPCTYDPCARGTCLNQKNSSYICQCPPGYDGQNCSTFNAEPCSNTVGLQDGRIMDKDITARSSTGRRSLPKYARLDLKPVLGTHFGSWSPRYLRPSRPYVVGEWIQVDLKKIMTVVAIITQGYSGGIVGISGFKISYGTSVYQLQVIRDNNGNDMIFQATPDHDVKTRNNFPYPVSARYIRLILQEWRWTPFLRMEYITC